MADHPTASSETPVPIAPIIFKARRAKAKANTRKRSLTPPPVQPQHDSGSDSDSGSGSDAGPDIGGIRRIKRQKHSGAHPIAAGTEGLASASTGAATVSSSDRFVTDRDTLLADSDTATKQSHMFDDGDRASVHGKKTGGMTLSAAATTATAAAATTATTTPSASGRSVGPVKAAANIRTITITDFAPDVCKDYKLTGFCGFGDNCKFLHAREDYKQGWQLDNEWESVTKGKKNLGGTIVASADRKKGGNQGPDHDADNDDEEAMLRDIPFACVICQSSYKQPVVTRCGHYFCERCALTRYRRDPSCAACGAATTGVFNTAKRLTKLLERKRERAAERRQAAMEAGEEVSSEEEE